MEIGRQVPRHVHLFLPHCYAGTVAILQGVMGKRAGNREELVWEAFREPILAGARHQEALK